MASWSDRFKEEQIVVNDDSGHNKFWAAVVDANFKVTIRWGRIGTKGQSQEKECSTDYSAANLIDTKLREKTNKGYYKVTKQAFDKLCIQAAIVGASNKCHDFTWVHIDSANQFTPITDDKLADPNCNPGVAIALETRKEFNGKNSFKIVFTFDKAYEIISGNSLQNNPLITKSHPLYELTQKVEEAIGRSLS